MANTTFTAAIFAKEVIRNLDRDVILLGHTNRGYEGEIKKGGDSVRVQTLPTLTFSSSAIVGAGDFANADIGTGPGGVISATDFTVTLENLVIDRFSSMRVTLTDHEISQNVINIEAAVAKRFTEGLGIMLDNRVRDQILVTQVADIPAANKLDSGAPITLTTANVYSSILALRSALKKQNVLVKNMRLFVGVDAEALLLQSSFLEGSGEATSVLMNGNIGTVGGVPVFTTTALDASKEMIMMAEGSVNTAVQLLNTKTVEGTDGFYNNLLTEVVFGMKIFGENAKAIAIQYVA